MMACGWIRGSKRLILLKSGEKLTRLRGDLAFYQATTGDYRRLRKKQNDNDEFSRWLKLIRTLLKRNCTFDKSFSL